MATGTSGSESDGFNWGGVGSGLSLISNVYGVGAKYGNSLLNAWGYGNQAFAAYQNGVFQKWGYDMQAAAYRQDAKSYAATAGEYQREGNDEAYLRYQQLNYDVGRIRTAAAGSGIDLSSDVVKRTDAQTRAYADYDVTRIQRNAANKGQSAISQARNALINAAYATANGKLALANGKSQAMAYLAMQKYGLKAAQASVWTGGIATSLQGAAFGFSLM